MINSILEKLGFKKKKKPLYTKKQFTRYSIYKGDTYVYDSYTNQWLLWYIIADGVDDGSISEFDMIKSNPAAVMSDRTYNTEDWVGQETTLNDLDGCLPKDYDLTKEGTLVNNIDIIKEFDKFSNIDTYSSSSSSSNSGSSSSDSHYSSSDSSSSSSYDSGSSSSFSSGDSGGSCF